MPFKAPWTKPGSSHIAADRVPQRPVSVLGQESAYPAIQYSPDTYHNPAERSYSPLEPTEAYQSKSPIPKPISYSPFASSKPRNPPEHQVIDLRADPNSPASDKGSQVGKRNLKTRLGLSGSGSSKEDLPETPQDTSKALFGRRRSVVRRTESGSGSLQHLQHEGQTQWAYASSQSPSQQSSSTTFEPYGPDFTRDQIKGYRAGESVGEYIDTINRQYPTSPPQSPGGERQTFFEFLSAEPKVPQGQPEHTHFEGPQQISYQSPAVQLLGQPSSRPSSSHSQRYQVSGQPYNPAQILQSPQQPQQQAQVTQQPVRQPLRRANTSAMAPTRRQNQPLDAVKVNSPIPHARDGSSLHPGGLPPPPLVKSVSQTSQDMEQARGATPPVPRSAKDMSESEVMQLVKDHSDLKSKYNNVKRQYFDKKDQLEAMQTTLAHTRLSQSRTSLDDGEYINRMTRLDGLVSQLAFGIRKEWKQIPDWLHQSVNKDALTIAKQEMTAVGRAVISRWLADDFFNKFFHPGLDPDLSIHLKTMQKNIWSDAPPFHSAEDEETLVSKIVNWRLATVDGLKSHILVPDATEARRAFTDLATQQLVDELQRHLHPSGSVGLEGGIRMIVELAVGILANLPLESRDISIEYFHPGYPFLPNLMRAETGIPPLPGSESAQETQRSRHNSDAGSEDHDLDDEREGKSANGADKKGFFGGFGAGNAVKKQVQQRAGTPQLQSRAQTPKEGQRDETVRMAVFMGLQIRGKNIVLAKAPVFRM